jgi:hypothetical protein
MRALLFKHGVTNRHWNVGVHSLLFNVLSV